GSTYRQKNSTGIAPFTMSKAKTATPIRGPSTRNTFVAPRLPEPCLRRSTPFHLPARYAAGIDPSAYAATSARTSVMSALAAHQNAQWIAVERIRLAETVVQEPDVMLGDEVGRVPEN